MNSTDFFYTVTFFLHKKHFDLVLALKQLKIPENFPKPP